LDDGLSGRPPPYRIPAGNGSVPVSVFLLKFSINFVIENIDVESVFELFVVRVAMTTDSLLVDNG